MNANELRIGNYIKFDQGIGLVCSISTPLYESWNTGNDENVRVVHGKTYYECTETELQPIPLNENLLLKCGFIANEEYEHPSFDELIHKETEWFGIGDFNGEYWIVNFLDQASGDGSAIRSLHQLQNLYFAVTGKELEVKI